MSLTNNSVNVKIGKRSHDLCIPVGYSTMQIPITKELAKQIVSTLNTYIKECN